MSLPSRAHRWYHEPEAKLRENLDCLLIRDPDSAQLRVLNTADIAKTIRELEHDSRSCFLALARWCDENRDESAPSAHPRFSGEQSRSIHLHPLGATGWIREGTDYHVSARGAPLVPALLCLLREREAAISMRHAMATLIGRWGPSADAILEVAFSIGFRTCNVHCVARVLGIHRSTLQRSVYTRAPQALGAKAILAAALTATVYQARWRFGANSGSISRMLRLRDARTVNASARQRIVGRLDQDLWQPETFGPPALEQVLKLLNALDHFVFSSGRRLSEVRFASSH